MKLDRLSDLARKICVENNLHSVEELLAYYAKNRSFRRLRNCNRNLNDELVDFCELAKQSLDDKNIKTRKTNIEKVVKVVRKTKSASDYLCYVKGISKHQKRVIEELTLCIFQNASARVYYAMKSFLENHFNPYRFINRITIADTSNFSAMTNIDENSRNELDACVVKVLEMIVEVSCANNPQQVKKVKNRYLQQYIINEEFTEPNIFVERETINIERVTSKYLISTYSARLLLLPELHRFQREVTSYYIHYCTQKLSVSSEKSLSYYLGRNYNASKFFIKMNSAYKQNFKSLRIKSEESLTEIKEYYYDIIEFVNEAIKINDKKELQLLKIKSLFFLEFKLTEIPVEILNNQYLFQTIQYLINSCVLYSMFDTIILRSSFNLHANRMALNLEQIAEKVRLSTDRIRQIRNNCFATFGNKISLLKAINDDLLSNYQINISDSYLDITDETVATINTLNKTNYSKEFISYVLSVILSDHFSLIGEAEDLMFSLTSKKNTRHNWTNLFLVSNEFKSIDFMSFINDVDLRLGERINESYSFNIRSYLANFMNGEDYLLLEKVMPLVEKMLYDEFNLSLDIDDELIFERNTVRKIADYVIEALEYLDEESSLDDIYDWVEENYPGVIKKIDSIKSCIQRSSEICSGNKSGRYVLKKWKTEPVEIKGGTTPTIVYNYILDSDEPVHIMEIMKEVSRYRSTTNVRSLITSIRSDPQGRFVVFNQMFVGLKQNEYDSALTNLPYQLGKQIKDYVRANKNISMNNCINNYAALLNIDEANMRYIIEVLIENKVIILTNENLSI